MARGRTAVPKAPTKFLNSKRRVIYMTAEGKYLAKSAKGATVYNPKARFVKSPGGTERSLLNSQARVPTAIRPKLVRKVRSDKYKTRGVRAGVKAGMLQALFASPKGARLVSPGSPLGLAGMKIMKKRGRYARAKPVASPFSPIGLAAMKIMVRRKRSNAGKARGPRWLAAMPKL
jgi:hypothetical protein